MRDGLHKLARDFDRIAVPKRGRYLEEPARAEDGSALQVKLEPRQRLQRSGAR
jgi:hypothetical protein